MYGFSICEECGNAKLTPMKPSYFSYHVWCITYIHTYSEVEDDTKNFFPLGLKNDQKVEDTFFVPWEKQIKKLKL